MSGHRAKKRFGQHFLHDRRVIERIVRAFAPQPGDVVAEIGPGQGVLTHALLGRVARLHAIELDRDLVAQLQRTFPTEALILHSADALDFDFRTLVARGEKLRLIGNLPYNISTPLLFHLLDQAQVIHDMLFMLQKEVVDRMAAAPGGRDYGRLSVMVQWRLAVEKLFDVGPGAFSPPPQVESAVVHLTPHATPPIAVTDAQRFSRIVQAAFAHRRKTLRNNLKGIVEGAVMTGIGIDPSRRAETLTLEEFARLAHA
jgi:16S rRNA (adenine1518-N6/adenine1519-N6)-dimethyltransferase